MRYQFPADRDQLFYTPPANNGEPLLGSPGRVIPIYLNPSLSVVAIDITEMDGSPLTGIVTLTPDSLMPDFLGPDGVDRLWINTANGPYALLPRSISRAHRATSVSEEILRSKIPAETFPRIQMRADGGLFISDGDEDPSAGDGALWTIRGRPNEMVLRLVSGHDASIHSVFEITDASRAPIVWVGNINGLAVSDNLHTDRSVFGPDGFFADIYGYLKLLTWGVFAHAGPPGNMATYNDSSAEFFQGSRSGSMGNWVGASGTSPSVIDNLYGLAANPGESFHNRSWYKSGWGQMVGSANGTATNAYPCSPGDYIKAFTHLRMASPISREFYGVLRFWDASNALIAATVVNDPVMVDDSAWVAVPAGGIVPEGAEKCSYQFVNDDALDADTVHESGFGVWRDSRQGGASDDPNPDNVWSPPLLSQPGDGIYFGTRTGDWYIRTDRPFTAGMILYCLDGGPGWTYSPKEISAVGHIFEARWIPRL